MCLLRACYFSIGNDEYLDDLIQVIGSARPVKILQKTFKNGRGRLWVPAKASLRTNEKNEKRRRGKTTHSHLGEKYRKRLDDL